jgi:hypothetical protein
MFEDCNKTHTGGGKRLMTSTRKRVPTRQPIQIRRRVQALWFGSTLLAFGLLSATGCAVNPATGQRQFMLISESAEIEMGREADGPITESLGLYESEALQATVRNLGN